MRSSLTVTTAATSTDLTVLATVKQELGITNNTEDAKLQTWIRQASQIAATYCKRVFAQETVRETFRAERAGFYPVCEHAEFLSLSRIPVASITSVIADGSAVDASDYELDADKGFLYRLSGGSPSCWSFSESISVNYVGGYELLDTLPQDVERAVIMMVRDFRADATRDPNLIEKETVGVSRYRWWAPGESKTVLPVEISGLLEPYVRKWGWMI